ncbi:MAG: sulfotransferase domain-containing protein [Pseudomonadota bacterium]
MRNWFKSGKDGEPASKQAEAKVDSLPSVPIVTLPKSGTDFTVNGLLTTSRMKLPDVYRDAEVMEGIRTGYTPDDPRLISTGNFDTQTLNVAALKLYRANGHIVPMHMAASHHNIMALTEAGHKRLTLIMREPRDATVSLTHHIAKAGPDLRNLHTEFQYVPIDYHDWPHPRQVDYQVRIFLPRAVSWIESWLGAIALYPDLEVQLLHFDDLRHDSTGFLKQVIEYHGIPSADLSLLPAPKASAHFRSGQHDQWRTEFDEEAIRYSDWLIGDRLAIAYKKAVAALLDRAAQAEVEEGAVEGASRTRERSRRLLDIVRTFPWVGAGFDAYRELRRATGVPIADGLEKEVADYLESAPPVMKKPWDVVTALSEEFDTAH